jgi:hypothetical protein
MRNLLRTAGRGPTYVFGVEPGDEELVAIGEPGDGTGIPCRRGCGRTCVIDDAVWWAIQHGGSALCKPCADKLWLEHPDGFRRVF